MNNDKKYLSKENNRKKKVVIAKPQATLEKKNSRFFSRTNECH
jgi:hypothetical protein